MALLSEAQFEKILDTFPEEDHIMVFPVATYSKETNGKIVPAFTPLEASIRNQLDVDGYQAAGEHTVNFGGLIFTLVIARKAAVSANP